MARGASSSSSAAALAPGFRFHPTDEELVSYYLRRKLYNKPFRFEAISVVDIYKFEPWDLPDLSLLKSRDLEWYFFCILDKKYGNGRKTNRATEQGYWKTTGKDRAIQWNSRAVGMKKTLVFHIGRAPKGERTNWVMHEYRMVDEELGKEGIAQDAFVLCRIFQKSGPGPKNGEMYGAPFIEEEWDEDVLVPKKESSDDNEQKMSSCGSASANQRRRLNDPEWKYKQKSTAEFRSRLESDQWRDVGQVDEVGSVPRDSLGVMIGGSRKKQRQKGPMDFYCRLSPSDVVAEKGKKVQTTIENRYKKEERNHTISYVVRWLYQAGIAFNTVKLKSFKLMIEAIGQFGPGFEPPTYYELREPLLKQEVNNTKKVLETYKMAWKKYGCTIMYDGWTDQRGKSLINFLVNCPEGTMFLKSIDISDSVHDKEFLFKLLDDVVEEIGEENVVQVVTDNAAAYVAAGDLLMDKRRKLFWAPCAANSIDLMLSDIGKLPSTSAILTKGRAITTFIYKYTFLLNMMRRKIRGKDLIRPAITRFSTAFLTLQSIYTHKNALRALFVSNTYSQSKYAKKPEGLRAFSIVMSATFWKGVANSLKAAHPLVKVLRIINSEEKPPMGNIYQAMVQAREQIKATFNDNEKDYKPILDIIDRRWYMQLNYPLHLAAYFLNPSLYYAAREVDENSLARFQEGFYECLERMVPDHVLQDQISIQVLDYKNARGVFGRDIAIRQRTTIQPIEWWDAYGIKTPDLKTLAFRILGLTCRASSCECNWSTFEHIHTKKRNRLEQKRLNDLVFVQYNQRLREKFLERQEQPDAYDPISLDELDSTCEWLVKQLEDKVAFEGDDLTMLDVDPTLKASQVKGSQRPRRQSKTVSPAGTSKRARQQEIEEEIDSEETGEDEVYMEGDDDDDDDDGDDALGNWREDENIDFRLEDFC